MKAATTDWIIFLDSDDYYDRRTVEYLMGLKDQYNVDLVSTPVIEVRSYEDKDFSGDLNEKGARKLERHTALIEMFYGHHVGTH